MADAEEKKTLAELETEVDEEGDGKALVRATSTIFGGRTEARATKKFLSSKKRVEFYVWARDLPYAPGSTIPIQVSIKNTSEKQVRSIMATLQTKEGVAEKGKKLEPLQTGKKEEWFQGSRFPLDGYTDYDGSVTYQLPRTLPSSSESITHEILFQFDVKGFTGWTKVFAPLVITVKKI
ncbi:uncharacterized protein ACA1_279000 [Acanthamoeba castellanii str. Neff]|uniref:Arrestin C-terminal-like domain-containing protein n=1 Tax=Acanthamoeba castellanii (strain ATCC 30010 / Neff) TaxID=1257118 RepID=L8H5X8_ACACF|nr:uncharacterized protein ACA1_279000 [Acanthamoeba castellanii str. Neff]ELR20929.1 hypothetical protein ACA1_279000 [Acanthamoeba castellanii str. Neff]